MFFKKFGVPPRWPKTQGQIISFYVIPGLNVYVPHVEYGYTLDGRSYTSSRFWYLEHSYEDHTQADRELGGLALGQAVTVRYDPAQPSRSTVRTPSIALHAGVGLIALVVFGAPIFTNVSGSVPLVWPIFNMLFHGLLAYRTLEEIETEHRHVTPGGGGG